MLNEWETLLTVIGLGASAKIGLDLFNGDKSDKPKVIEQKPDLNQDEVTPSNAPIYCIKDYLSDFLQRESEARDQNVSVFLQEILMRALIMPYKPTKILEESFSEDNEVLEKTHYCLDKSVGKMILLKANHLDISGLELVENAVENFRQSQLQSNRAQWMADYEKQLNNDFKQNKIISFDHNSKFPTHLTVRFLPPKNNSPVSVYTKSETSQVYVYNVYDRKTNEVLILAVNIDLHKQIIKAIDKLDSEPTDPFEGRDAKITIDYFDDGNCVAYNVIFLEPSKIKKSSLESAKVVNQITNLKTVFDIDYIKDHLAKHANVFSPSPIKKEDRIQEGDWIQITKKLVDTEKSTSGLIPVKGEYGKILQRLFVIDSLGASESHFEIGFGEGPEYYTFTCPESSFKKIKAPKFNKGDHLYWITKTTKRKSPQMSPILDKQWNGKEWIYTLHWHLKGKEIRFNVEEKKLIKPTLAEIADLEAKIARL